MPAPKSYSHTIRYEKEAVYEAKDDKWIVDSVSLVFVFVGFFLALGVFTSPEVSSADKDIATYQMIMLFGGLMMGFIVSMIGSKDGLGFKTGFPNRKGVEKWITYTFLVLIPLMVINRFIMATVGRMSIIEAIAPDLSEVSLSVFSTMSNVVLTAAIAEEAIFAFAFGIMFFKFVSYIIPIKGEEGKYIKIFIAAMLVSVLFWVVHIGRYSFDPAIATLLIVNRFVYTIVFYLTKDLKYSLSLHFLHNLLSIL